LEIKNYSLVCLFSRQIGFEALKELIKSDHYTIDAIFTHKYEPNSTVERPMFSAYQNIAKVNEIPFFIVDKFQEALKKLKKINFHFLISIGYKYIIPIEYLKLAKLGSLNMHRSLLPKYKGLKPLKRALESGEKETGVSIHYLTEKVDSGRVLDQEKIIINKDDTVVDLFLKIYPIYPRLLIIVTAYPCEKNSGIIYDIKLSYEREL